jgi:lipopolysaccharide assembly outer membrane protein LptD (OstA)
MSTLVLGWLFASAAQGQAPAPLRGHMPVLQPGKVQILAHEQYFDQATSTFIFDGDVEASQPGSFVLKADRVVYYQATGWIQAEGRVQLNLNEDVLNGDWGTFNVRTRRAKVYNVHAVLNPSIIVEAAMVEKLAPHPKTGADRYFVEDGTFTACNRPGTGWNLHARTALVHMNNYLRLYGVTFRVRSLPLFYLPYYLQSIKRQRASGFLPPSIGYDNIWGSFLDLQFFWAIASWADMTLGVTPFGSSRVDASVQVRFRASGKDPINVIDARYEHLFDPARAPLLGGIKTIRILRALLAHEFPGKIKTSANIQLQNNQIRDDLNIDPRLRASSYTRSEATAVRSWGSQSLRLLALLTQGLPVAGIIAAPRQRTLTEKLPSLSYTSGAPWDVLGDALKFRIETAALEEIRRREVPFAQPDPKNPNKELDLTLWRFHFVPTLQSTITLPGISIEPSFSLLETYYSRRRAVDPSFGPLSFGTLAQEPNEPQPNSGALIRHLGDGLFRHLYRVRVELTGPSFYRLYGGKSKSSGKYKHLIQPTVTYQFSPSLDESEIIDTGELNIDRQSRNSHLITYGLSNSLLYKKGEQASPVEVMRFDVTQTYSFLSKQEIRQANPGILEVSKLGDLAFSLQVHPSASTNSTIQVALDPDGWRIRRISANLGFSRRLWGFEGNYLRDATIFQRLGTTQADWTVLHHSVGINGHFRLGHHFEVRARGLYDILNSFVQDGFLELGYGTQCWGATLGAGLAERPLSLLPNPPTDNHISISFSINLKNLGSLGTTQRLR